MVRPQAPSSAVLHILPPTCPLPPARVGVPGAGQALAPPPPSRPFLAWLVVIGANDPPHDRSHVVLSGLVPPYKHYEPAQDGYEFDWRWAVGAIPWGPYSNYSGISELMQVGGSRHVFQGPAGWEEEHVVGGSSCVCSMTVANACHRNDSSSSKFLQMGVAVYVYGLSGGRAEGTK